MNPLLMTGMVIIVFALAGHSAAIEWREAGVINSARRPPGREGQGRS